MSNPNKIHYPRGYTSVAGIQFNPKIVVGALLTVFALYAVYKYGQFAAEKSFNMTIDKSRGAPKVELLSWMPRVFYHHNFLTDSDISSLTEIISNSTLKESSKNVMPFPFSGAWFEELQKRVARFTQEPVHNLEVGFFSKYEIGKDSDLHRDWFNEEEAALRGSRGNRVATLIFFLSDSTGAEYVFPKANLKVTPQLGDALLIWNMTPDHKIDELATYSVHKVSKSILWTYSIYIRERGV